jgi:hypothetical protein
MLSVTQDYREDSGWNMNWILAKDDAKVVTSQHSVESKEICRWFVLLTWTHLLNWMQKNLQYFCLYGVNSVN